MLTELEKLDWASILIGNLRNFSNEEVRRLEDKLRTYYEQIQDFESYMIELPEIYFESNLEAIKIKDLSIQYDEIVTLPLYYFLNDLLDAVDMGRYVVWENPETGLDQLVKDCNDLHKIRNGKIRLISKLQPGSNSFISDDQLSGAKSSTETLKINKEQIDTENQRIKSEELYKKKIEEFLILKDETGKELEELVRSVQIPGILYSRRISATRDIAFTTETSVSDLEEARERLLGSNVYQDSFKGSRMNDRDATTMLTDFNDLMKYLISDYDSKKSKLKQDVPEMEKNRKESSSISALEEIIDLWNSLFDDKKMEINGLKIVTISKWDKYNPQELSDGERTLFYLMAQCIASRENTVIIIDEPELHINKAILVKFWLFIIDKLSKTRAFIFITHDPEFWKLSDPKMRYAINYYIPDDQWDIEKIPIQSSTFPDHILNKIIGSTKPILLVEGNDCSLDIQVYTKLYPDYQITTTGSGSCEEIINSIKSQNFHGRFHRIPCYGIIDRDDRSDREIEELTKNKGIVVIPCGTIENLFLLPEVVEIMFNVRNKGFGGEKKFDEEELKLCVFEFIKKKDKDYAVNQVKIDITNSLLRGVKEFPKKKKLDSISEGLKQIINEFGRIDPSDLLNKFQLAMEEHMKMGRLKEILKIYRNKNLINHVLPKLLNVQNITKEINDNLSTSKILRDKLISILPELPK